MSRQVELVSSTTLEIIQGYLDVIRKGKQGQPLVLAMTFVEDGSCPVEWVRDALADGMRSQAVRYRQIAATPGYRYTEGRSAAHYEGEANRCEALADHIDTGEEFTFESMHVPPTAAVLAIREKDAQEKQLELLRDQPTAAFADARGRELHFLTSEDRIYWATFQRGESGLKVAGQGIVNVDFPLKSMRGSTKARMQGYIEALRNIKGFTERIQLVDNSQKV